MSTPDNTNDPRFVEYYRRESESPKARARAQGILAAVLRVRARMGEPLSGLRVADIGCNAGTQSRVWLELGHFVDGLDVSEDLVAIAVARNCDFGERASFHVGSAVSLPWEDETFDVCLLPELLEHVEDWESCLVEAVRVLKRGGAIYVSTTNVLCPVQQEFNLPLYSWYPGSLKRYFERRSRTTSPQIANYATYPAVNWFSPYGLSRFLSAWGVKAFDRFDVVERDGKPHWQVFLLRLLTTIAPLRFVGHVLTPSTTIVGIKGA